MKHSRFLLIILALLGLFSSTIHAQMDRVDSLLSEMSLQQKVAQMFMVHLYGSTLTHVGHDVLENWQPGAVLLMSSEAGTPDAVYALVSSYQQTIITAGGLPLWVATDQEGGLIARLTEGFVQWPAPALLTAAGDDELAYQFGFLQGQELRSVGVNLNLAPVADVLTELDSSIIGRRAWGSDPQMIAEVLVPYVRGLQDAGVMATAKHFPGHGDTREDSHLTLPVLPHDIERLKAVEFVPFAAMADQGHLGAVMVGHLSLPLLQNDPSVPSSLSGDIVTGLLREELAYDGIIMTDALGMDAIDTRYTPEEAAVMAVSAGIDMVVPGNHFSEQTQVNMMQAVVEAVQVGSIPLAQIDASVRRILETKARFGVLDWPTSPETFNRDDAEAVIEGIFYAGTTLVDDRNLLLPLVDDATTAIIYPANRSSIRRACEAYATGIRWMGISDFPTTQEIETARVMAKQVERVIIFTRDAAQNPAMQGLVNALPAEKTGVVALISPFDWLVFPQVSTYLVTYSPLDPAIQVACAILWGRHQPTGSLAYDLLPDYPAGSSTAP